MSKCSKCGEVYDGAERFCPIDGTRLPGARIGHHSTIPPEHDRLIGTVIQGRYRVIDQLGEGGMGVVYTAEHVEIEKKVALKVLRDDFSKRPEVVERFRQEARAASRIGHENIVDVTDFGQLNDGGVYFVMEYLKGMSLSEIIQGTPVSLERVVPIVIQIAHALKAAHTLGIVHRDLKPENIFLTKRENRDDFVKILDFGIAKISDRDSDGERLTKTGMIFGTPEYMSPEQASGKSLDHRVDIYALGCIMFELFTGDVPFDGESFMAVLTQHMFEEIPDIQKLNTDPKLTESVRSVVYKAMSKEVKDRYQDMSELEQDLERAVRDSGYVIDYPGRETPVRFPTEDGKGTSGSSQVSVEWADSVEIKEKKNKLTMVIGTVLAVLLIAAGAAIYLLPRDDQGKTKKIKQLAVVAPPVVEDPPAVSGEDQQLDEGGEAAAKEIEKPAKIEVLIQSDPKLAVIFIEGLGQVCSSAPCKIELEEGKPVEIKAQAENRSTTLVFTPSEQNKEIMLKVEQKRTVKKRPAKKRLKSDGKKEKPSETKPRGLKIPGIFRDG
ncbi:MAG: serine/threonine protein kinase [Proteobacteria bacterium]|nr:serine/threonine protein kinase [Pseudomonadota bacterium]